MEKKRILVIDDEAIYIEMLKIRLEANGYEVISASNGIEGIKKAQKENPGLILTDISLPDINGFQISRTIKSGTNTQNIKVIVCTNKLAIVSAKEARESMADEFVEKSSDCTILLKTIKNFINK